MAQSREFCGEWFLSTSTSTTDQEERMRLPMASWVVVPSMADDRIQVPKIFIVPAQRPTPFRSVPFLMPNVVSRPGPEESFVDSSTYVIDNTTFLSLVNRDNLPPNYDQTEIPQTNSIGPADNEPQHIDTKYKSGRIFVLLGLQWRTLSLLINLW
ncbi:hypothetical protein AAE478_000416 [Parahypoxylon ruwenzoriense]